MQEINYARDQQLATQWSYWPKPSFGGFMLRSVKTAPTDMSANPSHLGGETTFRLAVPCQALGVIVSSGVICAATTWLEKSLNVKDSTIRSWMPIKNTIRPTSNIV